MKATIVDTDNKQTNISELSAIKEYNFNTSKEKTYSSDQLEHFFLNHTEACSLKFIGKPMFFIDSSNVKCIAIDN
jgi:hypothetical protein